MLPLDSELFRLQFREAPDMTESEMHGLFRVNVVYQRLWERQQLDQLLTERTTFPRSICSGF